MTDLLQQSVYTMELRSFLRSELHWNNYIALEFNNPNLVISFHKNI